MAVGRSLMSITGRVTSVSVVVATVATMAVSRLVLVVMRDIVMHLNLLWIVVHIMADLNVLWIVVHIMADLHVLRVVRDLVFHMDDLRLLMSVLGLMVAIV